MCLCLFQTIKLAEWGSSPAPRTFKSNFCSPDLCKKSKTSNCQSKFAKNQRKKSSKTRQFKNICEKKTFLVHEHQNKSQVIWEMLIFALQYSFCCFNFRQKKTVKKQIFEIYFNQFPLCCCLLNTEIPVYISSKMKFIFFTAVFFAF